VWENAREIPGGETEYFLTFTDNKTRYIWLYILKTKDLCLTISQMEGTHVKGRVNES